MPILILVACALMAVQPRLTRWIAERRARGDATPAHDGGPLLLATVYATGIYGGYFGAGQGVILIALLAILIADDLQRLNGLKNAIAVTINAVAAVLFIAVAPVAWEAVILLALGSIVGGQIGAGVGRRMSPSVLRITVITVGADRRVPAPPRLNERPFSRSRTGPDRPRTAGRGRIAGRSSGPACGW